MKHAKIAAFKAKLSSYLRCVRAGESVTIYDRDTPVADVVPHQSHGDVHITEGIGDLRQILKKLGTAKGQTNVRSSLDILLEDRKRR